MEKLHTRLRRKLRVRLKRKLRVRLTRTPLKKAPLRRIKKSRKTSSIEIIR